MMKGKISIHLVAVAQELCPQGLGPRGRGGHLGKRPEFCVNKDVRV